MKSRLPPQVSAEGEISAVAVRQAGPADSARLAAIYAWHVENASGSFEEIAPSAEEMLRRLQNVQARGLPWLLAEVNGEVVGYSYASPYHQRSAYRFSVQSSTYVDPTYHRRGIGIVLLNEVIGACARLGYKQVLAAIGDSLNEPALALYARAGFRTIGQAMRVGVKFGRWTDVVYVQRALGDPALPPPEEDPSGYVRPSDQTGP